MTMTMTIDETQIIEIKKWEFQIEIKNGNVWREQLRKPLDSNCYRLVKFL